MISILSLICFTTFAQSGYIVTLKSHDRSDGITRHMEKVQALFSRERSLDENKIEHVFDSAFKGYSAQFSERILNKVKAMHEVAAVEEDQIVNATLSTNNSPWGLARIKSRQRLAGNFQNLAYSYDFNGGRGVDVYVIDTGINIHHPEFQGRAVWGANFVNGSPNMDDNGHGTHCAGTIASRSFGVAKAANVIGIKVLNAQAKGLNSQIIAGIEWAIRNRKSGRGNVMNLSLGSGYSPALNSAVRAAKAAGFVVAVAAGNNNIDACTISPASEPSILTVGATNIQDSRASFSNWGRCLDVFAPGENILSTWNTGYSNYLSGTSMATPHVAGLAAYLIAKTGNQSPDYIMNLIKSTAEKNVVSNTAFSPNLLVSIGGY
ncbi:proteinase B [Entomophthora muscae]|uniref:Proteinase B n=1 Tax=Entomophthora muscae TaxID=34485 RepID=A0ACC2U124_9FUNG|nr:proteinase B [Entomophthora muscae]